MRSDGLTVGSRSGPPHRLFCLFVCHEVTLEQRLLHGKQRRPGPGGHANLGIDVLDVVGRMNVIPVSSFLFTKLDETTSYGGLFDAVSDFQKPLSFVTMGQNVPNDIEVAGAERLARLITGDERMGR